MPTLTQGKVLVTNWHVFEPQAMQTGGVERQRGQGGRASAHARDDHHRRQDDHGPRQPLPDPDGLRAAGRGRRCSTVLERRTRQARATSRRSQVESVRYVESDTALVNRILGREVGGKQNILVMNDEAHHAYRIQREPSRRGATRTVRRRGRRRGVLQGSDGLDRRAGPDPQAARHQLLRRPVGDPVLPRPRRPGDEPAVPVGRERLRPDRRHRVGAGQDSAARGPRHDRARRSPATSTSGSGSCRS